LSVTLVFNYTAKKRYKNYLPKKYCHFVTHFFIIPIKAVILLQINNDTMAELTKDQKKQWAKDLYLSDQNLTQKEVAERVGTSAVTMNSWVDKGGWKQLKESLLVTRESQLRRMYLQLDELNTAIMSKGVGKRFADPKEVETIRKLTNAIKSLENESSIADIVEVCKRLLNWLRPINPILAKSVAGVFDDFIKSVLKKA
jgi:DNA-binding transcriptional regulator GbsR (MarR family)